MVAQGFKVGNSFWGMTNSACGDFSRSASAHSLQRTPSASHSFASHNHENSLTILEFADSAELSLRGESMDTPKQSKQNNLHEVQTESRPIRGAKNRIQGCSSATADFLLESDKRGSPPKSEKRQLLARRGSVVGGAALLRKENGDKDLVDSKADLSPKSCKKIDSKFALNSRDLDSSLTVSLKNDESLDCHESLRDSRNDGMGVDLQVWVGASHRHFGNEIPRNDGLFDSTNRTCNDGFILIRSKF